uniref:Calreticulin n=1 Tax=Petromyzon marinus TaxID=7757 RepID=A0AAJ7WTQ1_PETMA|nr:calreticulin-like [Petromyzon marinus]
MMKAVLTLWLTASWAMAEVFFEERFSDGDGWQPRWVESQHKSDYGKMRLSAGAFYGDAERDKGLQTTQDVRFYAISAAFPPFSNKGRTLVLQFSVKHEQDIDCGGGYVKLFPAELDQQDMHGDSRYYLMFGPDICGPGTKKVHVIINYKGKNHLINKDIRCRDDEFTHLYTLVLRPDQTYEVKIDGERVESGSLEDDWDVLPPRRVEDPAAVRPDDWDERPSIDDPHDTKPEDWDQPEHIPDPDAKKPDDWDDEMDGEWEPPMVENPDFKSEWKPKQISNPDYKGTWVHPKIDNPDFASDPNIYYFDNIGVLGLDLWQVKSGTIFDNFLITDDEQYAEEVAKKTWGLTKDAERKMKEERRKREDSDNDDGGNEGDATPGKQDPDPAEDSEEEEDDDEDDDEKEEEVEEEEEKDEVKEEDSLGEHSKDEL